MIKNLIETGLPLKESSFRGLSSSPEGMRPTARVLSVFLMLLVSFLHFSGSSGAIEFAPTVRAVAAADVLAIPYGIYSVREYLDIHNDSYHETVEIYSIRADTWTGRRVDSIGENWMDRAGPIRVPPNSKQRIAERTRLVKGVPRRNWWVRWVKFRIESSKGPISSNFISSPLKRPGIVEDTALQPGIDSMSQPGLPRKKTGGNR